MLKKRIAVAIGAALIVGTAWTATALAANVVVRSTDVQPGVSETVPTVAPGDTVTVPLVPGTVTTPAPTVETTPSIPWGNGSFGAMISMLAHLRNSGDTSGTILVPGQPFGWTVRMLAHMKDSRETTMSVLAPGETLGQWVHARKLMGESVDGSATVGPHMTTFAPHADARMKSAAPKVHAPKMANSNTASAGKHGPTGSAMTGSPSATAPGRMQSSGGMMGSRH